MNYTFRDVELTEEEFKDLKWAVGEYRRVCREQIVNVNDTKTSFAFVRYKNAESILSFLNQVEYNNTYIA